jgi:hypothetical protein
VAANHDLRGSTPMGVYDACVRALTDEGLIVIPHCHLLTYGWCCSDTDGNGLWFNETWPADRFVSTWHDIATRYADNRLTGADIDWCWWALNPTHAKGSTPVTGQTKYNWGDREPYGLLAADWHEVGNLTVLKMLKSMIHARTGPGIA